MMIPVENARRGSPEARFNRVFKLCQVVVECTIGILKSRWRCLRKERALYYDPITAGI